MAKTGFRGRPQGAGPALGSDKTIKATGILLSVNVTGVYADNLVMYAVLVDE